MTGTKDYPFPSINAVQSIHLLRQVFFYNVLKFANGIKSGGIIKCEKGAENLQGDLDQ